MPARDTCPCLKNPTLGLGLASQDCQLQRIDKSIVVQAIGTDFGCATAETLHRTSNTVLWLVSNQIPCFEARRVNSMLFQNCRDGIVLAIAQYRISYTWNLVDARSLQTVSRVSEGLELLGCKPGSDVNFDIPYSKPFDPNGFPASGACEPSHLDALHYFDSILTCFSPSVSSHSACNTRRPVPELRFLPFFHVFASWLGRLNILNASFSLRFAAMR